MGGRAQPSQTARLGEVGTPQPTSFGPAIATVGAAGAS
jgi:hypothetical protein